MIGQLFEHLRAGFDFAILKLGRNLDPLGLLAGAMLKARSSAKSTNPPTFSPSQIGNCLAINGDTLIG